MTGPSQSPHDDDEGTDNLDFDDIERELDATYAAIDDAVRAHLLAHRIRGITAGWVLLAAIRDLDEDGDDIDGLFDTHSDGLTKWTKIGLLQTALDNQKMDGMF